MEMREDEYLLDLSGGMLDLSGGTDGQFFSDFLKGYLSGFVVGLLVAVVVWLL